MIQRIQTIYLALIVVFSALLFNGPFLNFTTAGSVHEFKFSGIYPVNGSGSDIFVSTIPLAIVLAIIPVIALITIFLYKNRKLQIKMIILSMILIISSVLLVVFYTLGFKNTTGAEIFPNVKVVFPVISLILAWLAYRGIKKDENLVRSYDRLR